MERRWMSRVWTSRPRGCVLCSLIAAIAPLRPSILLSAPPVFHPTNMQQHLSNPPNATRAHLAKHPLMLIGAPSSGLDLVRDHLGLAAAEPAFWVSGYARSWLGSAAFVHPFDYGGRNPWGRHMAHWHRGLILVVSSTDRTAFGIEEQSSTAPAATKDENGDAIPTAKEMLALLFAESERHQPENYAPLPLLVLATEQDQPDAFSLDEITRMLGLRDLSPRRSWRVSGCDAVSGEGLAEAAQWLHESLDITASAVHSLHRPIRPIRSSWTAPSAASLAQDLQSNHTSTLALQPKTSSALPARAILSANRTSSALLTWLPALLLLLLMGLLSSKRVQSWRAKKLD